MMFACRTGAPSIRARLIVVIASIVIVLAAASGGARAGTYTDYTCHTPDAHVAGADGWSADLQRTSVDVGAPPPIPNDQCANFGELSNGLPAGAKWEQGDRASLVFRAPAGETIADFRAAVCGMPASAGTGVSLTWTGPDFSSPGGFHAQYGNQLGCAGTSAFTYLDAAGFTAPEVWFTVSCLVTTCLQGYSGTNGATTNTAAASTNVINCITGPCIVGDVGSVAVGSFVATLRDDSPPLVSASAGALTAGGEHSGSESLIYDATDVGGGLYRTVAQVKPHGVGDWQTVAVAPVDSNAGKCVDAGENPTDDYEFDALVPCRLAVQRAGISIDTTQLTPGDDVLRVYVEDAAGNRTDVISPRTFTVASVAGALPSTARGPVAQLAANNGSHASRTAFVHVRGSADRRVGYGRPLALTGRLVDADGRVIAGAQLELVSRSVLPDGRDGGAPWRPLGQVTTDKRGNFSARVRAGANRSIAVVYRANLSDPGWTSAAEVNVFVSAGVSLRVRNSHVRNHHSVVFHGKVAGRMPPGGILVTIQVLVGSEWTPVATAGPETRTKRDGTFKAAYLFKRTTTAATFRFRAVAYPDSAFAYQLGHSNFVLVHVRP